MIILNFLLLLAFTIPFSLASREAGNGGDGIIINGKIYTYDFVENGIHKNVYVNETIKIPQEISDLVLSNLFMFSDEVQDKTSKKLAELRALDIVFYTALSIAMKSYTWQIIDDFHLEEIHDEDGSDVLIQRKDFRQVAVRNFKTIKFSRDFLSLMDSDNITGMIFHELVYSITPLVRRVDMYGLKYYHQSSRRAREITSYLFTKALEYKGQEGLYSLLATFDNIPKFDNLYGMWTGAMAPSLTSNVQVGIPVSKNNGTAITQEKHAFRFISKVHYNKREIPLHEYEQDEFNNLASKFCRDIKNSHSFELFEHVVAPQHESYESRDHNDNPVVKTYLNLRMKLIPYKWTNSSQYSVKSFESSSVYDVTGNWILSGKTEKRCLRAAQRTWHYLKNHSDQ